MTDLYEVRAVDLRCGHLRNPLGIAPERVRFSWRLAGEGERRVQLAYRVVVVAGLLAEVDDAEVSAAWDSGWVESAAHLDIAYEGAVLPCRRAFSWAVKVRDEESRESTWSETAFFETELDRHLDWDGAWIGLGPDGTGMEVPSGSGPVDGVANAQLPAPYLRRSFYLSEPVASARLHVTALGLYEARLNGARVGDAVLTPGWTDYRCRIQYQSYDVTSVLRQGENVLGVILADGWYAGFFGFLAKHAGAFYGEQPEALVELFITGVSDEELRIASDEEWRGSTGAIRRADLLMGESIDTTCEKVGWDLPDFDASSWPRAVCVPRDERPLVADPGPAIRVCEQLPALAITRDTHGRQIVDFGQNLAGWVRLRLPAGVEGHCVIRHGEVLSGDGSLYTENLRSARASDDICFASDREHVVEPRFTFHGFRYAEVSGYPGELPKDAAVACVVHSDIERAGTFECSNPSINRLFANIDWGQRGNFIGIPTDCPQRDERLGWLGDAQIFVRTACYNRDVSAFFGKWLDDVVDAQQPSGAFTDVAPNLGLLWAGAPAWGDAGVIVPWTIWKMYGDRSVLHRYFSAMESWMDFIARDNPSYLREVNLGNNYGDWLAPQGDLTPRSLLATAYWAYDAALMAEIADAIDETSVADRYRDLRERIADAFARAFVAENGKLASDTQTAYVLGLHMDLIPQPLRARSAERLVAAIERAGWHLSTGFVGVGYLLPVLSQHGYSNVAYRLLVQDSFPSWRYALDRGATTIWERWDGITEEGDFQSPEMNSFNHYSLGSVGEWLYRFVLGIDLAPGSSGFQRVVVAPHPGGSLTFARGAYRSASGTISSAWERDDRTFRLAVEIPPGVTATVYVPSSDPQAVRREGNHRPDSSIRFPGAFGAQSAVFKVGSGSYKFTGPLLVT